MVPTNPTQIEMARVHAILKACVPGKDQRKRVVEQLTTLTDNLQRFASLLQAGLEPTKAREVLRILGYQTRSQYELWLATHNKDTGRD